MGDVHRSDELDSPGSAVRALIEHEATDRQFRVIVTALVACMVMLLLGALLWAVSRHPGPRIVIGVNAAESNVIGRERAVMLELIRSDLRDFEGRVSHQIAELKAKLRVAPTPSTDRPPSPALSP